MFSEGDVEPDSNEVSLASLGLAPRLHSDLSMQSSEPSVSHFAVLARTGDPPETLGEQVNLIKNLFKGEPVLPNLRTSGKVCHSGRPFFR